MASAYEKRIANYLASHPGASRAEARGHQYTPEHGGALTGMPRVQHFAGRTMHRTYTDSVAERQVNKAADNGNRVQIMVHTSDGWVMLGGHRGYSASYVAEQQAKAGGIRGAVALGEIYDGSDLAVIEPDDIDAWQIDELEV